MAGESYTVTFSVDGTSATASLILNIVNPESVYQKLAYSVDINILIVGDSIGKGSGASTTEERWFNLLKTYLEETYGSTITITNVSLGGNTSYAGYAMVMMLDDNIDYDLAIICYGQNDSTTDFDLYYESIIYAIQNRYPDCSIISILESSQKTYTDKMVTIQEIAEYYEISVADTIAAFNNSGYSDPHSSLTSDGVHPNTEGQALYFETVKEVINSNVTNYTGLVDRMPVLNSDVVKFKNFKYIDKSEFTSNEDFSFKYSTSFSGVIGIDYTIGISSTTEIEVYTDNELITSYTSSSWAHSFTQRQIKRLYDNCVINGTLKICFSSETDASAFTGFCFSWE